MLIITFLIYISWSSVRLENSLLINTNTLEKCWSLLKTLRDRKGLPQKHLIGCQGVSYSEQKTFVRNYSFA